MFCDGDSDCSDGSDEPAGCAVQPPTSTTGSASVPPPSVAPEPGEGGQEAEGGRWCGAGGGVSCAGRCVPRDLVCDGRDHCMDGGGGGAGSDEDPEMCCECAACVRWTRGVGCRCNGAIFQRRSCPRSPWAARARARRAGRAPGSVATRPACRAPRSATAPTTAGTTATSGAAVRTAQPRVRHSPARRPLSQRRSHVVQM